MLLNWPSPPGAAREILEQLLTALASSQTDAYTVARVIAPLRPTNVRRLPARRLVAASTLFLPPLSAKSSEFRRLPKRLMIMPLRTDIRSGSSHTDNAEAMWSAGTFCTLMMIGAWSMHRNGMPVPMH
ncbi:hypothetical protein ACULNC_13015 [Shigella flexneri]